MCYLVVLTHPLPSWQAPVTLFQDPAPGDALDIYDCTTDQAAISERPIITLALVATS
jgi:hypothetical protein